MSYEELEPRSQSHLSKTHCRYDTLAGWHLMEAVPSFLAWHSFCLSVWTTDRLQYITQVDMSRQVKLVADKSIQDAAHDTYDAIALPVSCTRR